MTKESSHYAACLTRLAELTIMPRRSGLAPGALLSKKHIFSRVEFLLKQGRDTNPRLSKAGLLIPLATLFAALLPCLLMSPVIALAARVANESTQTSTTAGAVAESVADEAAGEPVARPPVEVAHGKADAARRDLNDSQVLRLPNVSTRADDDAGTTSNEPRAPASSDDVREGSEAALVIDSVSRMSSSSDKRDALLGLIARERMPDAAPAGFFKAVSTIPSSLDKSQVLSALLGKRPGRGLFVRTLEAAEKIDSDSDKRELLIKASIICPDDDAALVAYLGLAATLRSFSDKERALSALLKRPALSRATLSRVRALALSKLEDQ